MASKRDLKFPAPKPLFLEEEKKREKEETLATEL